MSKKPKLTLQEQIQKSNEAFELLSPVEKRVQIAKDALAQLDLEDSAEIFRLLVGLEG
jgi:hypothetical protein